jgi:hypothetical protein
LAAALAVAVGAFTILHAGAAAAAQPDHSEAFFSNGVIPHLRIEITGTNLAALQRNNRNYVRATVREGDTVYQEVGIHLKGAAGSFRGLDSQEPPALTLNFDKFKPGQRFHGLDKLHLNNSVQDRSYMSEHLCAVLFQQAGVPAPRVTHALVKLNDRETHFYVLKEGFDKTFLRRHFTDPRGNLYDGGFLRDITEPLERTSGEGPPGRSELKALAQAALEPDLSKRWARLQESLDVERFISFVAMEIITHHWDGYALNKNNYRLYHDPAAAKVVFMPTGMDQMFWEANFPLLPTNRVQGLVASALLQTPEGRSRHRARVSFLVTNVFVASVLTNHINELQARIRPVLASLGADRANQHDGAVANLRRQVLQRARYLEVLAAAPEPQPITFDRLGVARLTQWHPQDVRATGRLEQATDSGGLKCLRIGAGPEGRCTASWRTRVILDPGTYVFEGRLRVADVAPLQNDIQTKGVGAGLRVSRPQRARPSGLAGTTDWQTVEYEFAVEASSEDVVLLCELRASAGEAWFDLQSLRLRRR